MRTKFTFACLFLLLFSKAFSQPQDSLFTTDSDSLDTVAENVSLETVGVIPMPKFIERDQFKERIIFHFTILNEITYHDIDNSIAESVGDLIRMRSPIDVVAAGSKGQPEIGSFCGNLRGVNVSIDENPFRQQDLYFPHLGHMDLNSVPLADVSRVVFLPVGLANLWSKKAGALGINLITKDFTGEEPYSKVTANRGPYGFYRTQVELGRGLTSRGKFYLTTEFKNSDGYLINSDYDGFSLTGETTFKLKRRMDLKLSVFQYKTEMGLPLFFESSFKDARKKLNNWGVKSTVLFQKDIRSLLNVTLRYEKQDQEIKSKSYGFEAKKIEEMISLNASQTLRLSGRHQVQIEGYTGRRRLEALASKNATLEGYLSIADLFLLTPTTTLLLSSKLGKEEGLKTGVSACAGVSYYVTKKFSLFSTLGRSVGYPSLMDRFWLPFSVGFKDSLSDYIEEGNPSLKSQKSLALDFGANFEKKDYKISGYIYGCYLDDFVYWSNIDTTLYYGHYKPANSKARILGSNFDLRFDFLNHMSSYLSYSFKQGKDTDKNTRLPYSPEHSFFGYIQFESEFLKREMGLTLRLETNVLSDRFLDEYEKDREPGVAILNGKLTIRLLDFHFYYAVRNITDQTYRLMGDYSMPERSYWWGFYWEFFD